MFEAPWTFTGKMFQNKIHFDISKIFLGSLKGFDEKPNCSNKIVEKLNVKIIRRCKMPCLSTFQSWINILRTKTKIQDLHLQPSVNFCSYSWNVFPNYFTTPNAAMFNCLQLETLTLTFNLKGNITINYLINNKFTILFQFYYAKVTKEPHLCLAIIKMVPYIVDWIAPEWMLLLHILMRTHFLTFYSS